MNQNEIQGIIKNLLESEYNATNDYDNAISYIEQNAQDSTTLDLCMAVLVDIRNEEQRHIGQLNELLKVVDAAQAQYIISGEEEADEQMMPYIDAIQ